LFKAVAETHGEHAEDGRKSLRVAEREEIASQQRGQHF
jgi:hypothetical protein